MNAKAEAIVRRIARLERRAIYNPTVATDRAIARLWVAFSNSIARG